MTERNGTRTAFLIHMALWGHHGDRAPIRAMREDRGRDRSRHPVCFGKIFVDLLCHFGTFGELSVYTSVNPSCVPEMYYIVCPSGRMRVGDLSKVTGL